MPNIKSAKKRLRQSIAARERNKPVRSRVKNMRRKFFEAVLAADRKLATDVYREYCSTLDKAAKAHVIHKNSAVRRKARAANKLRAMA